MYVWLQKHIHYIWNKHLTLLSLPRRCAYLTCFIYIFFVEQDESYNDIHDSTTVEVDGKYADGDDDGESGKCT